MSARSDAGFSIVIVVTMILLLLVAGVATVSLVTQDSEMAVDRVQSGQAFYVAHAGLEYAIAKLAVSPHWAGLPRPGKGAGPGSFWVPPPDTVDERGGPLPHGRLRVVAVGVVGRATRELSVHVAPGSIGTFAGGTAAQAGWAPHGLALAPSGDLYVADPRGHVVRRVEPVTGIVTLVAGTGEPGSTGDGGRATAARLRAPRDVCVAPSGDLYVADAEAHEIRKISALTGTIATVAGADRAGTWGDGGPAAGAALHAPAGMALSGEGDLFIAERGAHRVRRVLAVSGVIVTAAGTGAPGYAGDNGPAASARFRAPEGVALAPNGDLYVADTGNHVVRRIARATGIVTTVVGTGAPGDAGDGGPGTAAHLRAPRALAFGPAGDLYIADTGNHRVRRVEMESGIITTVAGTGDPGFSGDGGASAEARLHAPCGLAVSPAGAYFIADHVNGRVRRVSGVLSVVAWVESDREERAP
jgi:sugar lactone lactonase YvrE